MAHGDQNGDAIWAHPAYSCQCVKIVFVDLSSGLRETQSWQIPVVEIGGFAHKNRFKM